MKKRLHSIIIPFFAWSLIYYLGSVPLIVGANVRAGRSLATNIPIGMSLLDFFGLNPFAWPGCYALWYLRALFIIVLISPMLVACLRKMGAIVVIFLFALLTGFGSLKGVPTRIANLLSLTCSLSGLFYFSLGLFVRMRGLRVRRPLGGVILASSLLLLAVCRCPLDWTTFRCVPVLSNLSITGLILGTWFVADGLCLPLFLTSLSFPIYCCHLTVLLYYRTLVAKTDSNVWGEILTWGVVLLASSCAVVFIRRFLPCVSRMLFGGR